MAVITYLNNESKILATVLVSNTGLTPIRQITVQNQVREYQINSIEDLPDVGEVDVTSGSTVVYNANTDIYEIKKLDIDDVAGVIDGGEF